MKRALTAVCLLIFHAGLAPAGDPAPGTQLGPPRLDLLKDAAICPDGAGAFYLTGTAGTLDKSGRADFDYNRGAPLWRSTDLKKWECLGFAWDRVAQFARSGKPKLGVWLDWSAPADRMDGLLAHATTTPKLYRISKEWYLICAMNGQNILLQKSATGKAEGPYDDFAYLATRGGHPSLFVDDAPPEGAAAPAVYLVFGDAWIARLKPDLTALAEDIRPLLPAPGPNPAENRLTLGDPGVAMFKRGGAYGVFAARWNVRDGKPSHDAVLWTSEQIYGPYRETSVVLPGFGPVSVFQDAAGTWQAVSSQPFKDAPRMTAIPEAR